MTNITKEKEKNDEICKTSFVETHEWKDVKKFIYTEIIILIYLNFTTMVKGFVDIFKCEGDHLVLTQSKGYNFDL